MIFIILLVISTISTITYGQINSVEKINKEEFYCTGWLFDFPDSMITYNEYDSIPENTKYCVISNIKKKHYSLSCWTGEVALETPTTIKQKLKISFREDEFVIFRIGNKKTKYSFKNSILIKN